MTPNGAIIPSVQGLQADPDNFLRRTVFDLFSLKGRTVVITGGARGIGLALAFAVVEAGGNVAIIDLTTDPHPHYLKLQETIGAKVACYKCVSFPKRGVMADSTKGAT